MFRFFTAAIFALFTFSLTAPTELGGEYALRRTTVLERGDESTSHVVRLRARTALDSRWSAAALVQYNDAAERLSAKACLRFNVLEGRELWVVLGEGYRMAWRRSTPLVPRRADGSSLVRYTFTVGG